MKKKTIFSLAMLLVLCVAAQGQTKIEPPAKRGPQTTTKAVSKHAPTAPRIGLKESSDAIFSEDFSSCGSGWTMLDNDNDGNNWMCSDEEMISYSWYDEVLTPDNWLISPEIYIGIEGAWLHWFDRTLLETYPSEQYTVYVRNTEDSSETWVPLFDTTLTTSQRTHRRVSLASFYGNTIQIAFRHWNTIDMYAMGIDDISITGSEILRFAPEVTFSYFPHIKLGGTTTFTSDVESDLPVTYRWEIAGQTVDTSADLTYTWNTPGTFEVTLIVANAAGSNSATVTVTVIECNQISTFPYQVSFGTDNGADGGCWIMGDNWTTSSFYIISNSDSAQLESPTIIVPNGTTTVELDLASTGYATFQIYATILQLDTINGSSQQEYYLTTIEVNSTTFTTYPVDISQFVGQTIQLYMLAPSMGEYAVGVRYINILNVDCGVVNTFPYEVALDDSDLPCWTTDGWSHYNDGAGFYYSMTDTEPLYSQEIYIPADTYMQLDYYVATIGNKRYNLVAVINNDDTVQIYSEQLQDNFFGQRHLPLNQPEIAGQVVRFIFIPDNSNETSMALHDFAIRQAEAPEVSFVLSESIAAGDEVTISATTSSAYPVSYVWALKSPDGGDTIVTTISTDQQFSYTWTTPGYYRLVVTATNAVGSTAYEQQFTVIECHDTLNLTPNLATGENQLFIDFANGHQDCWNDAGWEYYNDDQRGYILGRSGNDSRTFTLTTPYINIPANGHYALILHVDGTNGYENDIQVTATTPDGDVNIGTVTYNANSYPDLDLMALAGQTVKIKLTTTLQASRFVALLYFNIVEAGVPQITEISPDTAYTGEEVNFIVSIRHEVISSLESYYEGYSEIGPNNDPIWNTPGTYQVTFTVTNSYGSDDTTVTITIIDENPCPTIREFPYTATLDSSDHDCWSMGAIDENNTSWAFGRFAYNGDRSNTTLSSPYFALNDGQLWGESIELSFEAGTPGYVEYMNIYATDNDGNRTFISQIDDLGLYFKRYVFSLNNILGIIRRIEFVPVYNDTSSVANFDNNYVALRNFRVGIAEAPVISSFDIPRTASAGESAVMSISATAATSIDYVWTITGDNGTDTLFGQTIDYTWGNSSFYLVRVCAHNAAGSSCIGDTVRLESCNTAIQFDSYYTVDFVDHQPCWMDQGWSYNTNENNYYAYYQTLNEGATAHLTSPWIEFTETGYYSIRVSSASGGDDITYYIKALTPAGSDLYPVGSGVSSQYFDGEYITFSVNEPTVILFDIAADLPSSSVWGIQSLRINSVSAPQIENIYTPDSIYTGTAAQFYATYFTGYANTDITWRFEGGDPTNQTGSANANTTWNIPGWHTVGLTLSNVAGSVDTTFRVYVHNAGDTSVTVLPGDTIFVDTIIYNYISVDTVVYNTVDSVVYNVTTRDTVVYNISTVDSVVYNISTIDSVAYNFITRDTVVYNVVDSIIWHHVDSNYYDTIYVYDTLVIDTVHITVYDTVQVSIDDVEGTPDIKLYGREGHIVVEGAQGRTVQMYDAVGRLLATKFDSIDRLQFDVPASGAYVVKIEGLPAKKIVIMR